MGALKMKRVLAVFLLGVVIVLGMAVSANAAEVSNKVYGPEEYHSQEIIHYKVFGPEEYHGQEILPYKVYGPEGYHGQEVKRL
jgi:hypothetical protein